MDRNVYSAVGKRKTSVAKVFLQTGNGSITINNKAFNEFFLNRNDEGEKVLNPLALVNVPNQFDIFIVVRGGGISSQLDAIRLALSKSLCQYDSKFRVVLKQNSLLTRDARIKERRKYGLKKARKASQYSKR
jgi:small subunit ribosomal protein S9